MLWWVLAGCGAGEAVVVTSPLVGAERIDRRGVDAVAEVLPAGSYTYLRLEGQPETWFVVTDRARPGETVAWRGFAEVHDFPSRRLDRTFDHLVFASIDVVEGQ
jgi:hypothetical protein